jgi:hypothetical protein
MPDGEVPFPELTKVQIKCKIHRTTSTRNSDSEAQVESLIFGLLEKRIACGAAPLRLVGTPRFDAGSAVDNLEIALERPCHGYETSDYSSKEK